MKLCGLVAIFSVIAGRGADAEFTYASFPVLNRVQYRVPLTATRTLTELTLCGWVKHEPVYVTSSFITMGDQGQFRLMLTQDDALVEVAGRRSGTVALPRPNTHWYHICVTWQSVGGLLRIYRDGQSQSSESDIAAGQLLEDITSVTLGNKTGNYVFAGRASYVQLYSRALDAGQVKDLSCSERCDDCSRYSLLSWGQIAAQISRTGSVYNDDRSPIYLPPPTDLRVQLQGPRSIVATWTNNIIGNQFQWFNVRISSADDPSSRQNIYTTVKNYIIIKDQLEDTSYEVEVSTQSRCGRESWSDPVNVTTLSEPDRVEDLQVVNTTNSTVTVSWSRSQDKDPVIHYRIVIIQSSEGSSQRHKTLDPKTVQFTFTDLFPNTRYTVKIAADSKQGVGEYSTVTAQTLSNGVDPDVNVTLNVEILPEFEVALRWQVSDHRESAYLYKLTIKKLTDKEKRNSYLEQVRNSEAEFKVDGKNTPFIEIKTSLSAMTVEGLVRYAPYHISVSICPDPFSQCRLTSEPRKIFVALAEQHYYQQFYSGGIISQKTVQDVVLHTTQNSSSLTHFTVTNIAPTSFLGKLTFSNQQTGENVTQGEMWYTLFKAQGTSFQGVLLGPSFQLTPVNPSGYCSYFEEEEQGKGNFIWPPVRENTLTVLPCSLNNPNFAEMRSRRCNAGGWEERANYTLCPYTESTSGDIQRLLDTEISNVDDAVMVSRKLTEVTTGAMTTETIGMASQAISLIVSSADNPDISFNADVAVNLAGALGNIQSLDRKTLANEDSALAAQAIVRDVEAYCLDLTGTDTTLINFASSDLKLALVKPPSDQESDIIIESSSDSEMSIDYKDNVHSDALLNRIGVKVPKQLTSPDANVLAVVYKDKSMFQTTEEGLSGDNFDIPILSLSISTVEKDTELTTEVEFSLTMNGTGSAQHKCVYWNTTEKSWKTEGVVKVYSDDNSIMCRTSHLTSFSALLLPSQDDYILSIISQIGTAISIVCLFITVLLLYVVRCVRECMSTKIHINFALALFLALLLFMINTSTTYPGTYCKAMAALTHYFFLTTFMWMSMEAVGLYRAVVLVFTSASNKTFLIVAAVTAWGLPAILVIVLLTLQEEVYKIHVNLSVCWLSQDWMYGTFFSPLLVMTLFNFLVFFRVLGTVIRKKKSRSKGSIKPGQRLVELRIIFSIMSLLGLTWIFAAIQVSTPHIVLQYLFSITNTLQGVAVFVFYCLYNPNIRMALWRAAHGQPLNETASNSSSQHKKKERKKLSIRKATRKQLSIVKAHIDGNPFAFSMTGSTSNGHSTLKKMNRKNWKKLKKNDIKHTNSQLTDAVNSKGAIVLTQSRPSSMTLPTTMTSLYSPNMSRAVPLSTESSPNPVHEPSYEDIPSAFSQDDVNTDKCCDITSENGISLDHDIVLELDKDNVLLHGSSEQCSTPDAPRSESPYSDCSHGLDQSQSSSYEKLDFEEDKNKAAASLGGVTV